MELGSPYVDFTIYKGISIKTLEVVSLTEGKHTTILPFKQSRENNLIVST